MNALRNRAERDQLGVSTLARLAVARFLEQEAQGVQSNFKDDVAKSRNAVDLIPANDKWWKGVSDELPVLNRDGNPNAEQWKHWSDERDAL
jgi:hypothetical protein